MGTPDFAVPALDALIEWGAEVVGVVSQPDRPKGRGRRVHRTPVAQRADTLSLNVFQWPRLNQESFDALTALKYDIAVVIAYGKILPARYLHLPAWGCINLHGSLLPSYRGAAPIQWALIKGETETGVSVMRLDEGMDTGDVALMRRLSIEPTDTTGTLHDRLSLLAAEALTDALNLWCADQLSFSPQAHEDATHAPMLSKATGALDWSHSSTQLSQLIRGVTPWPGASISFGDGALKVLSADSLSHTETQAYCDAQGLDLEDLPLGALIGIDRGPVFLCATGALRLTRVQRPSRKPTTGEEFTRGYPLKIGVQLA